jgi:antitoxin component YwqK of YwqJK toxin-antitoxin module
VDATYKKGDFDGLLTAWYPDGKIQMQGSYKNGLKEGTWKINKEDGTLEREDIYKNGILMNPVPEKIEKIDEKDALPDPTGNNK